MIDTNFIRIYFILCQVSFRYFWCINFELIGLTEFKAFGVWTVTDFMRFSENIEFSLVKQIGCGKWPLKSTFTCTLQSTLDPRVKSYQKQFWFQIWGPKEFPFSKKLRYVKQYLRNQPYFTYFQTVAKYPWIKSLICPRR